jgi:anaerobic magnesium-protoporphyrin IX monomethyl ester cyclase
MFFVLLLRQQPDVLAFSCLTGTYRWMLDVAADAKQILPGVKTVFGGVHISAVPDRVLNNPQVDYVVVGEGDIAFPAILKAIEKCDFITPIPNTRFRKYDGSIVRGIQQGFYQNLDELPFFDKVIWEDHIRIGDLYLTMASRGCPYKCTFCFNNFFYKLPEEKHAGSNKYVRQRSVDHVMLELKWANKRYDLKCIDFQDDVFTVNKPWIKEFTERYKKEIKKPFQCLIHPKYFDEDIARWMADAGCEWIQMGIQTMDEKFKHENLRRYEDSDHIEKALEWMHKYKMLPKTDHMLGLPGEPIGSQETALKLYHKHTPKRIQVFWTSFLPGTELLQQGINEGIVSEEQAERLNEGVDFYFFRNEDNINNPELVRTYQNYELIYKMLPALPNWLKYKLTPSSVNFVPKGIKRLLIALFDIYTGFRHSNPEFAAYRNYYLFHIYAFILRKIGLKAPKATKPKDANISTEVLLPWSDNNVPDSDLPLSSKAKVG